MWDALSYTFPSLLDKFSVGLRIALVRIFEPLPFRCPAAD